MTDKQAKQVLLQMLEWNAQQNSTFCGVLGLQMVEAIEQAITLIEGKETIVIEGQRVSAYDYYKTRCDFLEDELQRVRALLGAHI